MVSNQPGSIINRMPPRFRMLRLCKFGQVNRMFLTVCQAGKTATKISMLACFFQFKDFLFYCQCFPLLPAMQRTSVTGSLPAVIGLDMDKCLVNALPWEPLATCFGPGQMFLQ